MVHQLTLYLARTGPSHLPSIPMLTSTKIVILCNSDIYTSPVISLSLLCIQPAYQIGRLNCCCLSLKHCLEPSLHPCEIVGVRIYTYILKRSLYDVSYDLLGKFVGISIRFSFSILCMHLYGYNARIHTLQRQIVPKSRS